MNCRCGERAAAIKEAALRVAHGDTKAVMPAARFVARTMKEDAVGAARSLRQAASARLGAHKR